MNRKRDRLHEENILSDESSGSRRDFLKSVGKYSVAVVGSMALAGTQLSNRYAGAAETAPLKRSSSSSSQPMRKRPGAGSTQGSLKMTPRRKMSSDAIAPNSLMDAKMKLKSTPKLKSKFDDPVKLKGFNPLPCW